MLLVEELRQLPSSTAFKLLGLLDLPDRKKREVLDELVCAWLLETAEDVWVSVSGNDGFCWFDQLRDLPASLIEHQLRLVRNSKTQLSAKEKLVVRFTILFCAGKIVPNKDSITESQLRVLLAILRNL